MTDAAIKTEPAAKFPMAALLALSSAYFAVGTASLCVIGIVIPISADLKVSVPDVAYLVTVFALTFAVAAPTGQILFHRIARVKLLCGGLALMVAGLVMGAMAPNYTVLFLSRAVMGLGGAFISPMCSAIGAGMVPLSQQGRAMGIVFGGLTVSTVIGVPLSAYLGNVIGWRAVMIIVGAMSMVSMASIIIFVRDRGVGGTTTFKHLFDSLTEGRSALAVFTTLLQMASMFCTYALIAPYMVQKFAIEPENVFIMLLAYGSFGIIGNIIAGRLSDRWSPNKVILLSVSGVSAAFLILLLVGPYPWMGFAAMCLWAVFGMMFHAPQQQRIANISVAQRSLLLALNASALYMGMSAGSWISRTMSVHYGYEILPAVSFAVMGLCALMFYGSMRKMTAASEAGE